MARPYPPAWYPDPETPGQIRRWDGREWTQDVRAYPAWLYGLRPVPGPPPKRPLARRAMVVRRLWTASSITLAFALLLLLSLVGTFEVGPAAVSADRVEDQSFLAAAAETCQRANRTVLEPYRQSSTDDPEGLATAVEEFVDELRSIGVTTADRDKVDRWIAAWDSWTRAGHAYARAVDAGDDARAEEISEDSYIARVAISRFAYANGLGTCAL